MHLISNEPFTLHYDRGLVHDCMTSVNVIFDRMTKKDLAEQVFYISDVGTNKKAPGTIFHLCWSSNSNHYQNIGAISPEVLIVVKNQPKARQLAQLSL
jgi:hypothetical protein